MKWEVIVSLSGCFDELLGKTKQMEDYKIIIIIIIFTASGDSTAHVWKTTVNMIGKQVNTHTHTHYNEIIVHAPIDYMYNQQMISMLIQSCLIAIAYSVYVMTVQ